MTYAGRRRSALHVAASEGHVDVVRYLIAEVTPQPSGTDGACSTWGAWRRAWRQPLRSVHSLSEPRVGVVRLVATSASPLIPAPRRDARLTPLTATRAAAAQRAPRPVNTSVGQAPPRTPPPLITGRPRRQGADVNAVDRWGGTPLKDAAREELTVRPGVRQASV